jgi:hypothetical protein
MTKTVCKNKKLKDIDDPKFLCKKCKGKAGKKKELCKPEKISRS